jgi:hypothetical protein
VAVAITQTANPVSVASASSITTYSTLSVGSAAPGRLVVVCIGKEVTTVTVSSATITDNVGTRSMVSIAGTTFGNMGAWMYRAPVSWTATTVDIAITWSGAVTAPQNHITVYVITDAQAPQTSGSTNTSTDMDATAPLTTGSTTIATNGGMLACASCANDTVAKTWANLTEDLDEDFDGGAGAGSGTFRWTTATSITPGTATRTCTGTTNGEDGVLVWAIFAASADPFGLNMPPPLPATRE